MPTRTDAQCTLRCSGVCNATVLLPLILTQWRDSMQSRSHRASNLPPKAQFTITPEQVNLPRAVQTVGSELSECYS
jgi:hypothetical protein